MSIFLATQDVSYDTAAANRSDQQGKILSAICKALAPSVTQLACDYIVPTYDSAGRLLLPEICGCDKKEKLADPLPGSVVDSAFVFGTNDDGASNTWLPTAAVLASGLLGQTAGLPDLNKSKLNELNNKIDVLNITLISVNAKLTNFDIPLSVLSSNLVGAMETQTAAITEYVTYVTQAVNQLQGVEIELHDQNIEFLTKVFYTPLPYSISPTGVLCQKQQLPLSQLLLRALFYPQKTLSNSAIPAEQYNFIPYMNALALAQPSDPTDVNPRVPMTVTPQPFTPSSRYIQNTLNADVFQTILDDDIEKKFNTGVLRTQLLYAYNPPSAAEAEELAEPNTN